MNEIYDRDNSLINGFRLVDEEVFVQIHHDYCNALVYFAYRLINNSGEAEDIVEETFIKFWTLREKFKSNKHIKAFLYVTTRNKCLNYLRDSKLIAEGYSQIAYLQNAQEHTGVEMLRSEVLRKVHDAVESLPPQCRIIVEMSFISGKSNMQIAEELKLSMQTVKNQKSKGVSLLRIKLAGVWIVLLLFSLLFKL